MMRRNQFIKIVMTALGLLYFAVPSLAFEISYQAMQREVPGFRLSGGYLFSKNHGLELTLGKSEYQALKNEDKKNFHSSLGYFVRTPLLEPLSWTVKTMVGYESFVDEVANSKRRHVGLIGTDCGLEVRPNGASIAALIGTGIELRSYSVENMHAGSDRYRNIAVYPYIGLRSFF